MSKREDAAADVKRWARMSAATRDPCNPMGWRAAGSLDGKGEYLLVLPRGVADLLRAIRQAGESSSDVILTVASDRGQLKPA
jgi:hypothetical protein